MKILSSEWECEKKTYTEKKKKKRITLADTYNESVTFKHCELHHNEMQGEPPLQPGLKSHCGVGNLKYELDIKCKIICVNCTRWDKGIMVT